MKPVGLQYEPRDASGGRPPRGVWPLLLNIASIGAGAYLARLAWETAHYPGADNYAELALVVIGVPIAFFFQLPVLCLSVWVLTRRRDPPRGRSIWLLVALTAPLGLALPVGTLLVAELR